jgi:hypothetical protein
MYLGDHKELKHFSCFTLCNRLRPVVFRPAFFMFGSLLLAIMGFKNRCEYGFAGEMAIF